MSDIPIGSPPAPPGRHAAPRGWYADPVDRSRERYWDGWGWSRNTRAAEATGTPGMAAGQQLPGQQHPGYQQPSYQQHSPQQGYQQPGEQQHYPTPGQQPAYQSYPGGAAPAVAGPQTADGVPLAAWGWRFLAGAIDLVIVSIVGSILSLPVTLQSLPAISRYFSETVAAAEAGRMMPPTLTAEQIFTNGQQIMMTVITLVFGLLYFALFWRFKSATPGQLACSLRVVPDGQGRNTARLAWPQVVIRALVWSVPFSIGNLMMYGFGLLNALFPLWNVKRQALHDIAAKTQLVRIRQPR